MPGTSLDAANEFIRLAREDGRTLTQMQLQKLVYIAHGWRLALTDEPLTTDEVQAWDFGPVYPELYEVLKKYGRAAVTDYVKDMQSFWVELWNSGSSDEIKINLDTVDKQIIERVFDQYGSFPAYQLSAITHETGTPWSQTYERSRSRPISDETIKAHFKKLAEERSVAG